MTEFGIGIVFGMVLTLSILYLMFKRAEHRALQQLERLHEIVEHLKQNQIMARVEENNGVFYVYNVQDNTFMAQGTTVAELQEKIEQRWKNASIYVTEGDSEVLTRLKGTMNA